MLHRSFALLLLVSLFFFTVSAIADGPDAKEMQTVRDKAIAYLRKSQSPDGSYSVKMTGPGATSLVVAALLRNGLTAEDPTVAKALRYLEKNVKNDGGIYDKGLANYTTSVALMAFQEANTDGKYTAIIKKATIFLKGLQNSANKENPASGGLSYDKNNAKPDMSNTQYFVEALLAAGVSKDDPAIKQALLFTSRCQNLADDETNDQPFAKKASADDQGGLTYDPIDPEKSRHKTPDGGLRSLGAMTYGGLKTFLYAGVSKNDKRVQGAVKWIRAHYTLEENPGMGQSGLYYFYHTFGKAMDALGEDRFKDAKGMEHDWRKELFEALKKRQKEDGSFINATDRTFGEADPNLATAFALLTLPYTKGK